MTAPKMVVPDRKVTIDVDIAVRHKEAIDVSCIIQCITHQEM